MIFAQDENGQIIKSKPYSKAICPHCFESVVSKCGSINIWHWFHKKKCIYETEPMTEWYLNWQEIADALMSLGLGGLVARTLAYLNNGEEATSVALEKGTGLCQPNVSIVMRQSKEIDWINERKEKIPGKGRPFKAYTFKVGFYEIIAQLKTSRRKQLMWRRKILSA
jgi:predicted transcriptional regulator